MFLCRDELSLKPRHKRWLWLLILFHISFVAISSSVPTIAVCATIPCQAHQNESAVIEQKEDWFFSPGIATMLLHQQTTWQHLQTLGTRPCIWAETSERSVLAGILLLVEFMRPRRDRYVETLRPCLLYHANEQCWNERLSPCPRHPASLLSFLFPFVGFAVNYLSLL